jgi:hypothetical protein
MRIRTKIIKVAGYGRETKRPVNGGLRVTREHRTENNSLAI